MLIDTHAHLDEQSFHTDLDEVLERAKQANVESIFTIGVTAATSQAAVDLAERYPQIFAVVGIQPNYVAELKPDDMDLIRRLAVHDKVVAIGETGLDRYWDYAPIDLQRDRFVEHIALAKEVGKPFIVHCRDAEADVVNVLKEASDGKPLRGVMHSFCGSVETATECLDLGMHLSFAGMVTFKKNDELRSLVRQVPMDRILIETDSPYLAPVPLRGKRNEPANVMHTARCIADLLGLTLDEFGAVTSQNARALFALPSL